MATRLGVHLTQKPVASIGLGSLSVSPLEMAAAYATFAAGGIYARPTAIRKVILPGGRVDKTAGWGKPQTRASLRRRCLESQRDPRRERALRHGLGLGRRHPPERRQDRDDLGPRRCLVRRLHARPLDRGLDGLPARRDPDARRARPLGRGRDLPGADVAPVHGGRRVRACRCASSSRRATSPSTSTSSAATSAIWRRADPTTTTTTAIKPKHLKPARPPSRSPVTRSVPAAGPRPAVSRPGRSSADAFASTG